MDKIFKKLRNGVIIIFISVFITTILYSSLGNKSLAKTKYDNYYMVDFNKDGQIMSNVYFDSVEDINFNTADITIKDKEKGTWKQYYNSPCILLPENLDIAVTNSSFTYTTIAEWFEKTDKDIVVISTTDGIPIYLFIGDKIIGNRYWKDSDSCGTIDIDGNIIHYCNLSFKIIDR